MKDKYRTLNDLLNELEGQKYLYLEQIPAFSSFGIDIIEILRKNSGQDEESVWSLIKNHQITPDLILDIYRSQK